MIDIPVNPVLRELHTEYVKRDGHPLTAEEIRDLVASGARVSERTWKRVLDTLLQAASLRFELGEARRYWWHGEVVDGLYKKTDNCEDLL